ncbi:hypothetical protein F3Y22_tig00000773pilonHSYRG00143 [Hibiscus syriacus]|uniref:Uncharacterized protein n=1 Tax=Hibiscus syriacus TaxID=106335 RepID=A0A6A3CYB4_HIBSY|nr:hypothetical protein F3Y22_tig00000773pilonHSYRG00143 [Hibiscus syriacus]
MEMNFDSKSLDLVRDWKSSSSLDIEDPQLPVFVPEDPAINSNEMKLQREMAADFNVDSCGVEMMTVDKDTRWSSSYHKPQSDASSNYFKPNFG